MLDILTPFVLLDDARPGIESTKLFQAPVIQIKACAPSEVPVALQSAQSALDSGRYVAGYFSYELGYLLETRLASLLWRKLSLPLLWLGVFEAPESVNSHSVGDDARRRAHAGPLVFEWTEPAYAKRFDRLHARIAAGDLYQANLTMRARFAFAGNALAFYRDLKTQSRSGHCAFVADGERHILSLSPELFFEMSPDGTIRTRPMKGTAARGDTASADALARARLMASEKDRAENLMIVDLLRNDLSRIAETGSVTVGNLFEVETYPTLHQLVSTVGARRRADTNVTALIHALFPCGSVTGAPKIQAMEAIRELETSPRGVYCGAIGFFAPDGSASFNVAIRTVTISGQRGELGVGGGIVYDSVGAREYDECVLKARYFEAARIPLQLIETLRWTRDEGFVRGERHLARLARSAAAFGIACDEARLRRLMREEVAGKSAPLRVRITLGDEGQDAVTSTPLDPTADRWTFRISPDRVQSRDELLRHKTSRRETFDGEYARALNRGLDEVVFVNERGELTEGSRTNIFVELHDRMLTPAVSSGLLEGCLRAELIEQGQCVEAVLTPGDLSRARAVFLGNSLRGLVPAVVVDRDWDRT
ncbi:MAG: aminodeoxychorismate synthase component I [Rhizomicrobium sp.]|jgi:para-aminobenzoate synthetase/4-amino-4-deoxychorismate lyase